MGRRLFVLAIVSVAAAAASCAGQKRPAMDVSPPATQPADALIVYHRTGGVAGADDWITVTADGRMAVSGRLFADYETTLPAGSVAKLEKRFEGWAALDAAYPPPRGARDDFRVQIRYRDKTVTASGAAENYPPVLTRARLALEGLATRLEPREPGAKPAPPRSRR